MNIHNHIIFNISTIFIIKNLGYMNNISSKDWFFVFFGSFITCLLPDIDHPNSFIGRKIKIISKIIYNIFGHREITHSLFMLLIVSFLFKKLILNMNYILPYSTYYGIVIGYLNHILADMCTIRGVSLFWPINLKIKIPIINYFNKNDILINILIFIIIYLIIKHLKYIINLYNLI